MKGGYFLSVLLASQALCSMELVHHFTSAGLHAAKKKKSVITFHVMSLSPTVFLQLIVSHPLVLFLMISLLLRTSSLHMPTNEPHQTYKNSVMTTQKK
jgi:hypothetical protein